MWKIKRVNIKNPTYFYYNDHVYLKDLDAKLLKIDKKDYREIYIYYIYYITVKKFANFNDINSINPLCLIIDEIIGHFEDEFKHLVLDDVDENKEVLKKYNEIWEGVKKEIETINGGKKIEYIERFKKN